MSARDFYRGALLGAISVGKGEESAETLAKSDLPAKIVKKWIGILLHNAEIFIHENGSLEITEKGKAVLVEPKTTLHFPERIANIVHSFNQKCWHAMRIKRLFTPSDILRIVSIDCEKSDERSLKWMIDMLLEQEIIIFQGGTADGESRYRLMKDTGERCPKLTRAARLGIGNFSREEAAHEAA